MYFILVLKCVLQILCKDSVLCNISTSILHLIFLVVGGLLYLVVVMLNKSYKTLHIGLLYELIYSVFKVVLNCPIKMLLLHMMSSTHSSLHTFHMLSHNPKIIIKEAIH